MKRRLAAVLAADVVGYSRLMGDDEASTLAELQRHRNEIFEPKAAQHHGRTVKLMGDGTLMEFASVVDAVTFAVDLQTIMRERNQGIPENRQIVYRMGINLGDIVHQDDDIYGDGVNVTARLEALAEPGGICISRSARDQVRDKLSLNLDDQGEIEVKNIARPVRVFRVLIDDKAAALATPVAVLAKQSKPNRKVYYAAALAACLLLAVGLAWRHPSKPQFEPADKAQMALTLPDKPSIAVLPFDNLGDDKKQAYFADGMTDDLITDLSKLSGLFVISRNSTFAYKGKSVKVRQVAEELGVRYVLEGSVRRIGDQVRINAQLIDAFSGYHVWAERYDGSLANVFKLQDSVIGQIVSALAVSLKTAIPGSMQEPETTVPAAYDAFLKGLDYHRRTTPEAFAKAIGFYQKAIALDPDYSRVYAGLAAIYWFAHDSSWDVHLGVEYDAIKLAKRNLAKALEKPNAQAYQVSADMLTGQGRNDEAVKEIDRAVELEPNNPDILLTKTWILTVVGRAKDAETIARKAMRLNPDYGPRALRALGRALFFQHRHAEAAEVMERAVEQAPNYEFIYKLLASIYGHLGRIEDAKAAVVRFNQLVAKIIGQELSIADIERVYGGDWYDLDKSYLAHWVDGLRKAGVQEGLSARMQDTNFKKLVTRSENRFEVQGAVKVDAKGAKALFDRGVTFIDSRGSGSFGRGHVPGALNITYGLLTKEGLSRMVTPDKDVVFYCGGMDCSLSANSCAKALVWGYAKVYYFAGGYPAWKSAGFEVEK
ncbi:MAG: guanylyl cyclase [Alphaproteobacteria bacterium]|nr:guanylyl cyclase [Alphaproteobacteria bacterium]